MSLAWYFDHNATAPLSISAQKAMNRVMGIVGNPSSVHDFGRNARKEIETARNTIAKILGVESKRIVFTSGATEANNLALKHFPGQVLVTAIEHDCVYLVREDAKIIPVDENGVVCLSGLQQLLEEYKNNAPLLISVMAANNETGVIQPLEEVISLAKQYGAYVHSDIVQAIGRMQFPWHILDMVSISAHKIGGPAGVGCLVINPSLAIKPLLIGGGQERFYRPGTENILGIVGMAAALEESVKQDWGKTERLRDFLDDCISAFYSDSCIAKNSPRLPNTTMLWMPGVKSETQVMSFDLAGFAVSAGSACSSGKIRPSRVLQAMGLSTEKSQQMIRVSLGLDVTLEAIQEFSQAWRAIYKKCSEKSVKREIEIPHAKSNIKGDGHELLSA